MPDDDKTPKVENTPDQKTAGDTAADGAADETGPAESSEALVTPPPENTAANGPQTGTADDTDGSASEKPAAKKRSGVVSAIMVAVLIVLVGQGALFVYRDGLAGFFGLGDAVEAERIAALEEKLAALEAAEQRNAAATRNLAEGLVARETEITALSNSMSRLAEGGGDAIASDLETAKAMIGALEERLDLFEAETGERDPMLGADTNSGQQAQTSGDVAEMRGALTTLTDRFAAMNQSLEEAGGRIEALEETAPPENLDALLEGLGSRGELDGLAARLAAIEEADPQGAARAAVLALAATELARTAATSEPFVTELGAFAALAPGNSFAVSLKAYASEGAPTRKALLLEFASATRAISEAERIREGGGVWNWIVNRLTALFSIRKVGERDGDDWQSILARAENRIAIEDTSAAADELAKLTGPAAEGAAPWLGRVRARQQVDALVTGLTAQVFAELLVALESE